jgi:phosphate:Na+ symporter
MDLVFGLVGGLGLFLLGMKSMSEGMQAVAGNSLRTLIGAITTNRLLGILVGVLVTCVVQSSSITTVMVVGFVNSGVMSLAQAVGVIMGSNIGTTITGWILVLQIGKFGLPLLGAAAFVYLFARSDRWRYGALALMGVGMVFFGLELMKNACVTIKGNPDFEAWFQRFQADSYLGVLKCALVGCVMTALVQSSSATLGITISLAYQGVISYETAAALVLGENIGTTITALFAALGATTNARRAAYFHVLFNLVGVFWITLIFHWYVGFIPWLIGADVATATNAGGVATYPGTTAAIAATHSVFNIVNTLIFLPFVPLLVRALERLVPAKEYRERPHLATLDSRLLETPTLAIEQSRARLERMAETCEQMLGWVAVLRDEEHPDKDLADRLRRREQELDASQDEIAVYITNLLSGSLPHAVAEDARHQLRMADEYESLSDSITDLDEFDRKLRRSGHRFSAGQRADLNGLSEEILEYLKAINRGLKLGNRDILEEVEPSAKRIRGHIRQARRRHLEELSGGGVRPPVNVAMLAALNAYVRVMDHAHNIGEAVSGEH